MLVRMLKRRTSLNAETDAETFLRAEFPAPDGGYDLNASCYDVDAKDITRTHAEHFVSFMDRPHNFMAHIDVGQFSPPHVATTGETAFEYTRAQHRELRVADEPALRILAGRIHSVRETSTEVPKADVVAFIKAALATGHPEWTAFKASAKGAERSKWWKAAA